jgi:hypothetical protein
MPRHLVVMIVASFAAPACSEPLPAPVAATPPGMSAEAAAPPPAASSSATAAPTEPAAERAEPISTKPLAGTLDGKPFKPVVVLAHPSSVGRGITIRAWNARVECDRVFAHGRFLQADFATAKPGGPIKLGTNAAGVGYVNLVDPSKGPCSLCDTPKDDASSTRMVHTATGELVSAPPAGGTGIVRLKIDDDEAKTHVEGTAEFLMCRCSIADSPCK